MAADRRSARHVLPRLAGAALAAGLVSCGARTGLDAPDVGAMVMVDAARPPAPVRCIEVPRGADSVLAEIGIPASLRVVDVMLLIDSSASMFDEIDSVRDGLRDRVLPEVRALIPDAAFGVAFFGEFPVSPHGSQAGLLPYTLRTPITDDVGRVEAALDNNPRWGNDDTPEAAIEGVYQVATGAGVSPWVAPSVGCATGGVGGACFRRDAFRVIVVVTDAPMHNGPPGVPPIDNYAFVGPHTYAETISALRAIDTLVIGLGASDLGRFRAIDHLRVLAADSGAVASDGTPLAFDIGDGGERTSDGVVDAIARLAATVPLDVDAIVEDRESDGIDARTLVRRVRAHHAVPAAAVGSLDGSTFRQVIPGTQLTFELEIDASALPPIDARREIPARVVFRESGRSRIGTEDVIIVVPGRDGVGC